MDSQFGFLNSVPRQYPQKTSIQHWQLRDLISVSEYLPSQLLSVYHGSVLSYHLQDKTTTPIMRDISFQPSCMAVSGEYLAVGGQRSQVTIRSFKTDWIASTSVGGAINNCVHISKDRLYVCNNDETIKVYSLPSMENITVLKLRTAVNGVCVSPDGKRLIAIGDTNEVFMYNIGLSNQYELISTFTTTQDASFSCDWDHTSTKFAVGSQDGFLNIWDIRMTKKMAQISSTQPNGRGAVRCVKFSQTGSVDLLAFTEHTTFFNIVDTRNFENRDSVRVGTGLSDVNLTGLVFAPDSKSIFVGTEQVILEYDVETRKRRGFPSGQII